jgi:hypothetical protein
MIGKIISNAGLERGGRDFWNFGDGHFGDGPFGNFGDGPFGATPLVELRELRNFGDGPFGATPLVG